MAKTKKRGRTRPQSKPIVSPVMIGLVAAAAFLIVGGLILLSNQAGDVDVSQFPAKGNANAPVTIIEYSDYG